MEKVRLDTIEEAIEEFKAGNFVIVVDDEDRENEGDLIIAAEKVTPEKVNFMLKHARGVLCAPITLSRCKELDLPHQVADNTSVLGTPFTVTIDKLEGCTTGVSAADRAATIRALADPESTPATFGRPGHINPLYAQEKGVLRRAGHTEATIDLARMAGLYPAGALMEIMNEDGTMARLPELRCMADAYGLKLITIRDMIAYRLRQESMVEKGVEVDMPTAHGHFRLIPFRQKSNGLEHVVLFKGSWQPDGADTGARTLLVRHGRHLCLQAVRLRRTAAQSHGDDRVRRQGGNRLPEPRGTRHRTDGKDEGLQTAGGWHGHGRCQHLPGPSGR